MTEEINGENLDFDQPRCFNLQDDRYVCTYVPRQNFLIEYVCQISYTLWPMKSSISRGSLIFYVIHLDTLRQLLGLMIFTGSIIIMLQTVLHQSLNITHPKTSV